MTNISIIMPLYNAEKYLAETLRSLSMQTYQEYELICINDASTDSTMEILKHFQSIDGRIRILENGGHLGAAISRNHGIREAKGEYITFLDGDDIFDEEMLELAYQEIEKQNADIVMYEYIHAPSECIYEKKNIRRTKLFLERYCRKTFSVQDFGPVEFMNWSCSPCNKLYRKSFICFNEVEFQTLESFNDVYFVSMALLLASRIIMLKDRRVMLYARDHDVQTRISYNRDPMCLYQAIKKVGDMLVQKGLFEQLSRYFYFEAFYHFRGGVLLTKDIKKARQFYAFLQKEGIDNIIKLCNRQNEIANKDIFDMLEKYKNLDFGSKWYINEDILKFYLYKNKEQVISFFRLCLNQNKQIALWGAGKNGKILLDFLQDSNIQIAEVIDKDINKWEKIIDEYVIKAPKDVVKRIQVIVTTSHLIYGEVKTELENMAVEIFSIEEIADIAW